MTKLNQIIAVEKGLKTKTTKAISAAHHDAQKTEPLSGIERTYQPKDEDGEQLPSESKRVQVKATDLITDFEAALVELFDVVRTKDEANTVAKADVVVDDEVLLRNVPVTYLLFLEKQLTDVYTFVAKLPRLDPAEEWEFDPNAGVYASKPFSTTRTKKVPRNHVKAEATKEHPAQVEMWYEDVTVGTWTTRKFSGALPATKVDQMLARVTELQKAVKYAREEANGMEVDEAAVGKKVLDYVFAD